MKQLIREPLLHFAILAGLVFIAYQILSHGRSTEAMTIVVSSQEIERLAALYETEAGAPPSEQDLQTLITDHVQQQALAREARALGMADGDVVIERRLAQKMIFMLSETQALTPPGEAELEAWFSENQDRFREPQRTTFDHIFFSRADDPAVDIALADLQGAPGLAWRSRGDPFMLQRSYTDVSPAELTHIFGTEFAAQMAALDGSNAQWQGPVRSALGTHLVRINAREAAYLPAFSDIRNTVERAWREQAQRRETAQRIQSIVDKYEVEFDGDSGDEDRDN
nr:peptidylprolyl isomerase [Hyphomonas sp. Mor2]